MMTLTRRRMFQLGSAAVAASGLYGLYKWTLGSATDVVVSILERRLGNLHTDPHSFERFAGEYVIWKQEQERALAHLSILSLPLRFLTPYTWLGLHHPLRRLENNVVGLYLLSTDFFQNGADEKRKINYVAFYDPAATPCRNPFCVPVDSA